MEKYNVIYKENEEVFGSKPTPIVVLAVKNLDTRGKALDIGSGQGRDSLFVSQEGFAVTAVDSSRVAVETLSAAAKTLDLHNIHAVCADISEFTIGEEEYDLITAINVLQFLERRAALSLIEGIQRGLKACGIAVIATFITPNGFQEGELAGIFKDFDIILSFEGEIQDKGHPGQPEPHVHHVARIVARKRK